MYQEPTPLYPTVPHSGAGSGEELVASSAAFCLSAAAYFIGYSHAKGHLARTSTQEHLSSSSEFSKLDYGALITKLLHLVGTAVAKHCWTNVSSVINITLKV